MNNNVSRNFTSLKWEAKNTYLVMPARRIFGGLVRRPSGGSGPIYSPDFEAISGWNTFSDHLTTFYLSVFGGHLLHQETDKEGD